MFTASARELFVRAPRFAVAHYAGEVTPTDDGTSMHQKRFQVKKQV